jgi:hypothetical protein
LRLRFGHILRNAQALELSRVRGVPESFEFRTEGRLLV